MKFDKKVATKDGYYFNDYVVDINYALAKKLYGKTIRITGKVVTVKGLEKEKQEYDTDGTLIMKQGRWQDKKHILHPHIDSIK